ncbi:MAG: hypothetical protein ACJ77L_04105, partial [Solirubrobacteraceae bacterium]
MLDDLDAQVGIDQREQLEPGGGQERVRVEPSAPSLASAPGSPVARWPRRAFISAVSRGGPGRSTSPMKVPRRSVSTSAATTTRRPGEAAGAGPIAADLLRNGVVQPDAYVGRSG